MSIPAGPPRGNKSGGKASFARGLLHWHARHGRHDLPWQNTSDPYRIWLSEIMLQQTQVATVQPYYERFLARFPELAHLAAAPVDDVMALWSGLGYYARGRNLHACARTVVAQHGAEFPRDAAAIAQLPGIGRSTANSIAAFCFGARAPVLDGNVKRVLCRCFGVEGFPGTSAVEKRLWQLAEELAPARRCGDYNQALMDLGATVCTRSKPRCEACPLAGFCIAHGTGRTAALPAPKPRRAVPRRQATLLVLDDGHGVLLETRPPAGIWGGLQSLPELPAGEDPAEWAARRFACRVLAMATAPAIDHAFSHFRLNIAPLLLRVERTPTATEPGYAWLGPAELEAAALPAPVRRILAQTSGSSPLPSR